MSYLDTVFSGIGQVIVAGGGGGLVAFMLIKGFGKRWLDSYFETRATKLKNDHEVGLAELRRLHDGALKEVQAVIDKDLHRARKLFDREFDVLGEAWTLLVKAFDTTHSTVASFVTRIDRLNDEERRRSFEVDKFEHWQIEQVLALEGQDMVDMYAKFRERKRLYDYRENRLAFARFLAINAIFMPAGFKERFEAIDLMINATLIEFQVRIEHPANATYDAIMKLGEEGKSQLVELETMIHRRIWSASAERDKLPG